MTLAMWIAVMAAKLLVLTWVLAWGGAEWLAGSWLMVFIAGLMSRSWEADQIKLLALLYILFALGSFLFGCFHPEWRTTLL